MWKRLSWESSPGPGNTVLFNGRAASTVTLMPAAKGKGPAHLVTGKSVLQPAGIEDVLSRTKGQTRTTINYAGATFNALKNINTTRVVTSAQRENLYIHTGEEECMTFIVVRARSDVKVERSIRKTMGYMNLTRANYAVIIPDNPQYRGMGAPEGEGLHHGAKPMPLWSSACSPSAAAWSATYPVDRCHCRRTHRRNHR